MYKLLEEIVVHYTVVFRRYSLDDDVAYSGDALFRFSGSVGRW